MRVRGPAEQAESIETKRFKKSRGPLLSAREAGPRTELPADEALERRDRGVLLERGCCPPLSHQRETMLADPCPLR